jgi:hypothetical protein
VVESAHRGADESVLYRRLLGLALLVFVGLYGSLLAYTGSLPYVMDNNESFSSLWHAESLYRHGVQKSFGLADEAFSPHEAAHPYVHTHQGNFPRLFATLIYALGAQSIESQILITTLLVGSGTIGLMFLVLARAGGAVFAFITCLVFMTDYVLFAQWQVVTYRVWYGFLLFLALYCAQRLSDVGAPRWRLAAAVCYAFLFYFELVFAAFVAIFAAVYRAWLGRKAPRSVLLDWIAMGAGAICALTVVFLQASAYLGWQGLVRDIYFTFLARNDFGSSRDLMSQAAKFYESHNVIFWHNFQDRTQYSSIGAFVRSLTAFDWRVHTPLLSLLVWTLALGWAAILLPEVARNQIRRWVQAGTPTSSMQRRISLASFGMAAFALIATISRHDGLPSNSPLSAIFHSLPSVLVPALLSAFGLVVLAARLTSPGCPGIRSSPPSVLSERALLPLSAVLIAFSFLLLINHELYDPQYQAVWEAIQKSWGTHFLGSMAVLAALWLACGAAVRQAGSLQNAMDRQSATHLGAILLSGFLAYAAVYTLSPGYIFSGYLYRLAPFTVFLTDIVVGIAMFTAWRLASDALRRLGELRTSSVFHAYVAVSLAVYILGYWVNMQLHYLKWLPPTHYAFLKTLSQKPYSGEPFVVDNYAAPVAAYTREWAYLDPGIQQGVVQRSGSGLVLKGDDRYLWLADNDSNSGYARPRYYVCMIPQSFHTVVVGLKSARGDAAPYPGCGKRGLVRLAADDDSFASMGVRLVDIDRKGGSTIGFEAWAIVEFDWTRPMGLRQIDWTTGHQQ